MNYNTFTDKTVDVANDVMRRTLDTSQGIIGDFAHVYAAMLRAYHTGILAGQRSFGDTDAFAVLELAALARQAVNPKMDDREAPLEAAKWAIAKAAFGKGPEPVNAAPSRDDLSPEQVFQEFLDMYGGNPPEGSEFPDHWTMKDIRKIEPVLTNWHRERQIEREKERQERAFRAAHAAVDAAVAATGDRPGEAAELAGLEGTGAAGSVRVTTLPDWPQGGRVMPPGVSMPPVQPEDPQPEPEAAQRPVGERSMDMGDREALEARQRVRNQP
jgi:hypothetical protein